MSLFAIASVWITTTLFAIGFAIREQWLLTVVVLLLQLMLVPVAVVAELCRLRDVHTFGRSNIDSGELIGQLLAGIALTGMCGVVGYSLLFLRP